MKFSFPRLTVAAMLFGVGGFLFVFGFNRYGIYCESDMEAFLFPARDYAQGHYPMHYPIWDLFKGEVSAYNQLFYAHFRLGENGNLVSLVGHGFPLILSLVIRGGGYSAPFLYNTFALALLPVVFYWSCTTSSHSSSPKRAMKGGLVSVALLFGITS